MDRNSGRLAVALLLFASSVVTSAQVDAIEPGTLCEVTGDGVNLRVDSRITATSVGKAHVGDLVKTLREHAGWFRITPPESFEVWMHGKFVEPGTGKVTGDRVNVRSRPELDSEVLGKVSRTDRVEVLGNRGEWVRIRAPEKVGIWIYGTFLRPAPDRAAMAPSPEEPVATTEVVLASAGTESSQATELVRRADLLYDAAVAGGLDHADLSAAEVLYRQAQRVAVTAPVRHHVDLRLTEIGLHKEYRGNRMDNDKHANGRISELEAENNRLRNEYESRLKELSSELERSTAQASAGGDAGSTDTGSFTAVGWTWPMGKIWRRPGTHRLIVGGKTMYYLNSPKVDLNQDELWKEHVGIVGQVRLVDGWDHPVIDVEKVKILEAPAPLRMLRRRR